jgi:autotransporter-associated beta strand protein
VGGVRVWWVKSATLGLVLGGVGTPAALAQSLDIPLQVAQSADGVRLIVNVGIGGAAPRSYMFDTGSSLFNAAYSASAFGAIPSNMSGSLPTGVSYSYTSGSVYTGNLVSVPSLTFYPNSSLPADSSAGITLNANTPGGFTINAVYARNGVDINSVVPLQTIPGVFGGIYGIFGAGDFAQFRTGTDPGQPGVTPNTSTIAVGSPLGQAVVAGTTAGYVVAANGQPLSGLLTGTTPNPGSLVNGPQVGQSVTSCSPCVMLGLTPALLAQFQPMNTIAWSPHGGPQTFPNSNAPSSSEYGIRMNFSASGPGQPTVSWNNQPTLLDSGTPTNQPNSTTADVSGLATFNAGSGKFGLNQGTTFTVTGTAAGATPTSNQVFPNGAYPYNSPYSVQVGSGSNNNIVGVSFFLENSVLYDLAGQAVGYTPNFVTDTNIVTTNASPLVVDANSVPLGLAGIISGPGGVFINGGSATLSGTNTYTGPTEITGGMLALVGPGSIASSSGVSVSAGGLFDISGTTGGASIATLSGDAAGLVIVGAQTLTLSNASTTFSGLISGAGGGLQVSGGVETLAGIGIYSGPTLVDGGMLLVNGAITSSSLASVGPDGTLGGTGTVVSTAIGNGGTLMPGLPGIAGGRLTIAGNLTMASAATYLATVSPSSASFAKVTGTASLGGTLDASGTGGAFTSGAKYTVLTTTGGVGNSFSAFTATGSFGSMMPTLSYDAKDVYLTLIPADLSSHLPPAAPRNVISLAEAITAVNFGTPPLAFQNLFNLRAPQLQSALNELSGEAATGGQKAVLDITNDFMNILFNPYAGNRADGGGFGPMAYAPPAALGTASDGDSGENALAYTKANPRPRPFQPLASFGSRPASEPHWSVWGSAYGGQATVGSDAAAGSAATTTQVAGYAVGLDYRVHPDTVVGFALGGGSGNWSLGNGLGGGRSNVFQIGGFASQRIGAAYVSAGLAYGAHWLSTSRTVTVAGADILNADFLASTLSSRLEGGYRIETRDFALTPYAAVQVTAFSTPAYSETAAAGAPTFALTHANRNLATTRSEFGGWADKRLVLANGTALVLRARLAWAHDFNNDQTINASFQTLPGANFTIGGAVPAADAALLSFAAEYFLSGGWRVGGRFDGEFSANKTSYAGTATARKVW